MRVAGYVREPADPDPQRSAFSQFEEIRRYAAERSFLLVAVCQDARQVGRPTGRDGYLSLLGVVAAGAVEAVLLPGLNALSEDESVQELALWDLRRRGVQVLSTREEDAVLLGQSTDNPRRDAMRSVLEHLSEPSLPIAQAPSDFDVAPDGDVLIHIIASDDTEHRSRS